MKRSMLVMAMVIALAMSTMAGAFAGSGSITAPGEGEHVITNTLQLRASEPEATAGVAWAVRSAVGNPECGTTKPDLAGWRGGEFEDDVIFVSWEDGEFAADINVSNWERGEYCFAFNPEPFNTMRDQQNFFLSTATSKDQCKDGGWMTFGDYKNQGQCVSEFARMKS